MTRAAGGPTAPVQAGACGLFRRLVHFGHAHRIRAGARYVVRAVRIHFSGATSGTLDALVLARAAHDLPFIGDGFRDVGRTGTFVRIVHLVAAVRGRDEVAVEFEGRLPCIVKFREGTSLFLQATAAWGSVAGALPDPVEVIRHVADVEFVFC